MGVTAGSARDSDRGHSNPSRERWEIAVANGIASMVAVLLAPSLAELLSTSQQGLRMACLILGGGLSIALGIAATSSVRGRGMGGTLGIFGAIFGAIELTIGVMGLAAR